MHPIGFIKAHPLATVVLLATGAIALPAALGMLGSKTGINVSLPNVGGGG